MDFLLESDLLTKEERCEAEELVKQILRFQNKVLNRLLIEKPFHLTPEQESLFTIPKKNSTLSVTEKLEMTKIYKKLSKRYHPDLQGEKSTERMSLINAMRDKEDLTGLRSVYNNTFDFQKQTSSLPTKLSGMENSLPFYMYFRVKEVEQMVEHKKMMVEHKMMMEKYFKQSEEQLKKNEELLKQMDEDFEQYGEIVA